MNNILISIIVPAYNTEKYLPICLESLINQTIQNIEIIVIDDGSTDSTNKIIKKYIEKDSRIRLIEQENQGVSEARNKGLQIARGKYISFVDSDDWLDINFFEKLFTTIEKHNCDIAVAGIKRQRKKYFKYRLNYPKEMVYTNLQDKLDICKIPNCCYAWGKLFKRELIQNLLFKKGVYFEDIFWTPYVIKLSNSLVTVPNTYYFYRVNNSSIVKSIQSDKKQRDCYNAKKYLIDFYKENNLNLQEQSKSIIKHIIYIFNFPVLKIKEKNNFDTIFLFGFIPIFKTKSKSHYHFKTGRKTFFFRDLDSHYYLNILGLHFSFKNKKHFKYQKAIEYGLAKSSKTPSLIVSLTSFPERINLVHKTLNTLLRQSLKPDKLILWLAECQFPQKEKDLPTTLLELKKYGLEIQWCEDLKSYKKLVPALKMFPNDIIVTADDDLYYQEDWLESLYNEYLKNPTNIYTRRACGIIKTGNSIKIVPHYNNTNFQPCFTNQIMGGAGTLYPPNSLHKDVLDTKKILKMIPTYDDIYFWAMAVINNTKIGLIKNKDLNFYNVENSQSIALCKINGNTSNMNAKDAFSIIFDEYPEIIEKITIK